MLSVQPLHHSPVPFDVDSTEYDLFVGAIGYESRSTHLLRVIGSRAAAAVGAGFLENHVLHYESNYLRFAQVAEILSPDDRYSKELTAVLVERDRLARKAGGPRSNPLRVAVDISSMSRIRLADTVRAVYSEADFPIDVDWLYTPARYSAKLLQTGPVLVNDVIPGFEGWGDPTLPLQAVVGVGLEGSLVLGVLDDLEPADTWFFEPFGFSERYDRRISFANSYLLRDAARAGRVFRYNVIQPYTTFLKLSALVDDLVVSNRVVLLPLGPKIFGLMCFLLGLADPNISVWRLSADSGRPPVDRVSTGEVCGLRGLLGG